MNSVFDQIVNGETEDNRTTIAVSVTKETKETLQKIVDKARANGNPASLSSLAAAAIDAQLSMIAPAPVKPAQPVGSDKKVG